MAHLPHPFLGEEFELTSDCDELCDIVWRDQRQGLARVRCGQFLRLPGRKITGRDPGLLVPGAPLWCDFLTGEAVNSSGADAGEIARAG